MKLIAGCLLTVLLAVAYTSASAQSASSAIHGKVVVENSAPADAATIVLLNSKDSSIVRSTITNQGGLFSFAGLKSGSYLLFLTKLNYARSYSGPYKVEDDKDVDVNVITLQASAKQLNQVNVTGKKDFVEVKKDRTVLNVDQNIMSSGSTVYDVLRSAPGVRIVNDDILLRAGQKALISINGKPVLLTGEELTNLLRNYQSSSVSRIELIDNPSSNYDASASGGMINIILKKNKDYGSNAAITESAAVGNKYKFNTGINYSLKTEKWNLFASYNYSDNKTVHTFTNYRSITDNGVDRDYNVDYTATTHIKSNAFNLGTDYSFNPDQTVGFLFYGSDNSIGIEKDNTTAVLTNNVLDSNIYTHSNIDRHVANLNYNVNYKGNFGKNSTLSADLNYTTYNRHSSEMLQNTFTDAAGQPNGEPLYYRDKSPSTIHIWSENIDFSQVLSKTSRLDIGIKSSQVNSDNTIDFEQQTDTGYVTLPELSDHFIYKEYTNAAYLRYFGQFGKLGLSAGLRAEHTSSSALSVSPDKREDSTYFNVFPNIQLTYDPNKDHQLTLFYSYNITRPNYQDLNPFIGYVDQYYYNTGNPFLKPALINTIQLSDLFMSKYKVTLSAAITHNFFNTIFKQDDITGVYITVKDNIATRYRYAAQFDIPVTPFHWWNVDLNTTVLRDQYNYYDANAVNSGAFALEAYLSQDFTITPRLTAQMEAVYQSPAYYVIGDYKTNYYFNAGMRYSLFSNKGAINLSVRDIFNTDMDKLHTNYLNLDITQHDKYATRFVTATFTYRFGTSSIKSRSKSTDEQKRLGGSSNEN